MYSMSILNRQFEHLLSGVSRPSALRAEGLVCGNEPSKPRNQDYGSNQKHRNSYSQRQAPKAGATSTPKPNKSK